MKLGAFEVTPNPMPTFSTSHPGWSDLRANFLGSRVPSAPIIGRLLRDGGSPSSIAG
jgi:hypothetical protein